MNQVRVAFEVLKKKKNDNDDFVFIISLFVLKGPEIIEDFLKAMASFSLTRFEKNRIVSQHFSLKSEY